MVRTVLLSFMLIAPVWAQTRELNLQPADGWVDTGIDLKAGDTVKITARGQLMYTNARQANGPEGRNTSEARNRRRTAGTPRGPVSVRKFHRLDSFSEKLLRGHVHLR